MLSRQLQLRLPLWLRNLNFTGRTVSGGTYQGDHVLSQILRLTGVLSPAQITADQNNYSPAGINIASVLRLTGDGSVRTITGIDSSNNVEGRIIVVENISGSGFFFSSESASSTAANRFSFPSIFMPAGTTFAMKYDAGTSRWRLLHSSMQVMSASVFGIARYAAGSEYRNNSSAASGAVLTSSSVFDAAATVGLTDAATVAVDFATGFNFSVTLGGNRTLGNPTNVKQQSGWIQVTQDGTGSRTLSYASDWEFAGATAFTLSTAIGAVDMLYYTSRGATNHVLTGILKAVA